MLKCPNCGTDNMLTAIFCRGCGQKIDLNLVKPESFAQIDKKEKSNVVQTIITFIIVMCILAFLAWWKQDDLKPVYEKIMESFQNK